MVRRIAGFSILLWCSVPLCPVARAQSPASAWYLSGRVILDSGWPPDSRADIVLTCNSQPYVAAHTDKNGQFNFLLGAPANRGLQDASVAMPDGNFGRARSGGGGLTASPQDQSNSTDQQQSNTGANSTANPAATGLSNQQLSPPAGPGTRGLGDRAFAHCELQAQVPGYRSPTISLDNRRAMDNPNLGTIVLRRIGPAPRGPVSATELAAPKSALKAFQKGRQAETAKKLDQARQSFEKATKVYPKYAAAWCELGKLDLANNDLNGAQRMFRAAIDGDPQYLDSYLQLAALEALVRDWRGLAATTDAALRLDAHEFPQAYYLNALAHFNLRNTDAAEKSAREAERLDTRRRFPGSWRVLGTVLLIQRQFGEASAQLREYLRLAPRAPDAPAVRSRLAEIERQAAEGESPE
ncbi:MAG TPA: hypothetical protein VMU19_07435 [Bryobacteraceae bacterium]|nr:hypothetical protein [Bryobacteraceae bacterium]